MAELPFTPTDSFVQKLFGAYHNAATQQAVAPFALSKRGGITGIKLKGGVFWEFGFFFKPLLVKNSTKITDP
jgi:hypothetical protein